MVGALFLAILVVPVAELYVILRVAHELGFLPTIALLIGISILGAYLLKREGLATWRRLNAQLAEGKVPAKEVTDGAMIMFGGALLLTPGFLTDAVGVLFVLPPTRVALKGVFRKMIGARAIKRMGPTGYAGYKVYDTTVTRTRNRSAADPETTPAIRPRPSSTLEEGPSGSDSPDKG